MVDSGHVTCKLGQYTDVIYIKGVIILRRRIRWIWQKITRGFTDCDLWDLDHTIAKFVLPRLKAFKKQLHGYPSGLDEKQWDAIIGKMIVAFEHIIKEDDWTHAKEVDEGLELFGLYFQNLWD